jgi:predicted nuclease of predicted toxin-antitoxin system
MSSLTGDNSTGEGDGSEQAPVGWRFLVDENLPRELVVQLQAAGYVAEHVVDVGLRGHSDAEVYAYAQAEGAALVTIDTGFGNLLQYPPPHAGIVVVRLPDALSITRRLEMIANGLAVLAGQPLENTLVTIEVNILDARRFRSAGSRAWRKRTSTNSRTRAPLRRPRPAVA